MTRVGFVGCGGIMEEHYKRLAGIPEVKMVGHCDTEAERARKAADRHGGEPFTDCVQMLEKAKPHAIFIAVPPFAHGPIEEAAAERSIHMFIEKPIALDRAMAKRVAAAVQRSKVITSVGYCYRYCDTVAAARKLLKGRAISLACGCWHGGMPEVWWWRQRGKSGGQIVEQTTHLFDLVRYLCGEVSEVYAVASRGCMSNVKDYDVDDSSAVSLRLKNGASACVASTCCALERPGRTGLEIVTPELSLQLNGTVLQVYEKERMTEHRPANDMYLEEDLAFISAVRGGKRNRIKSPFSDALKTFYVTCAANESIHSGMPVRP